MVNERFAKLHSRTCKINKELEIFGYEIIEILECQFFNAHPLSKNDSKMKYYPSDAYFFQFSPLKGGFSHYAEVVQKNAYMNVLMMMRNVVCLKHRQVWNFKNEWSTDML